MKDYEIKYLDDSGDRIYKYIEIECEKEITLFRMLNVIFMQGLLLEDGEGSFIEYLEERNFEIDDEDVKEWFGRVDISWNDFCRLNKNELIVEIEDNEIEEFGKLVRIEELGNGIIYSNN